jgi:hypothetical protein
MTVFLFLIEFPFIFSYPHQNYIETDSFLLYVTHLIFLVICSIINLAIFIAYRRQQSLIGNNGNQQQQMQRRTESKLIVYTVCTFISHMLLTLLMVNLRMTIIKYKFIADRLLFGPTNERMGDCWRIVSPDSMGF